MCVVLLSSFINVLCFLICIFVSLFLYFYICHVCRADNKRWNDKLCCRKEKIKEKRSTRANRDKIWWPCIASWFNMHDWKQWVVFKIGMAVTKIGQGQEESSQTTFTFLCISLKARSLSSPRQLAFPAFPMINWIGKRVLIFSFFFLGHGGGSTLRGISKSRISSSSHTFQNV